MTRTLYLISSAAPPARHVDAGIRAAQARGWDVCLVLTPSAHRWATEDAEGEVEALRALTGHPVCHQYKLPSQADVLPAPDAILSAPATLDTLTKWADGHADTLALGLLTEALGLPIPVIALPYINAAQAQHPALPRAVATLRRAGVRVLLHDAQEPEGFTPHPPKHGNVTAYPWAVALDALPIAP
ncbi:flavoprotein [Streptomyces sp. Go40/10]|uniref:flavoprotein n=1 Tax=Streptomyces sp. Go40/10 TaxID=2825844 RepID=UPI001E42B521|nr:flavoprotein [Streptomyces sp. Go40/10]UFR06944.1 flavoprotein [Streptomyces sp. Go40/10]